MKKKLIKKSARKNILLEIKNVFLESYDKKKFERENKNTRGKKGNFFSKKRF
ncbi:MAG: hypothetical protein QXG86_02735 [Candidatus Woesearchaeota archaeon]